MLDIYAVFCIHKKQGGIKVEEYEVKYQFNSPVPEDCSTDLVPNGAVNKKGKRVIEVPILTSMTKYMFDKDLGNWSFPYSHCHRCCCYRDLRP